MLKRRRIKLTKFTKGRNIGWLLMLCAAGIAFTYIAVMRVSPCTKGYTHLPYMLMRQVGSYFLRPFPIFLVITSSPIQTTLQPREACAVEAASLHHPYSRVTLLTTSSLRSTNLLDALLELDNVVMEPLSVKDVLSGTPLEGWYYNGEYKDSPYLVTHLSDAVRLALLWKHGGLYLDTDVICLRPLNQLRNTIGQQSSNRVNGAVMVFEVQHPFLHQCMSVFTDEYQNDQWATQGPLLLERVIKRKCKIAGTFGGQSAILEKCWNIRVLKPTAFYPIPYEQWFKLVNAHPRLTESWNDTYTVHLWNKLSHNVSIRLGSDTILDRVAKVNCPSVYRHMEKMGIL